jgi:hypothetical protein
MEAFQIDRSMMGFVIQVSALDSLISRMPNSKDQVLKWTSRSPFYDFKINNYNGTAVQ